MNEDLPKFRSRFGVLLAVFFVGFAAVTVASGLMSGGFWGTTLVVFGFLLAFFGSMGFAVELSRPKEEKDDE